MSNVLEFPDKRESALRDRMVEYADRLLTEGKLTKLERNDLVGGIFALEREVQRECRDFFVSWFKNKSSDWLKQIKRTYP